MNEQISFVVQLEKAVSEIQKSTGCSDRDVGSLLLGIGTATLQQSGVSVEEIQAAVLNVLQHTEPG
jgi:hypothetical protein